MAGVGGFDGLVAFFGPGGAHRWTAIVGTSGYDRLGSVRVAPDGDVVTVGSVSPASDDEPITVGDLRVAPRGGVTHMVVAVWSPTGSVRALAVAQGPGTTAGTAVAPTSCGDVVVGGALVGSVAFPDGVRTAIPSTLSSTTAFTTHVSF